MTLEENLIEKLFDRYGKKGQNVQTVLDNQYFQKLPLAEKVRLIEKHRGDLSKDPKFNWTAVGVGAGAGAFGASTAVLMKQLMVNLNKNGGSGFSPNYLGLSVAGALGAGVGAVMQHSVSKKEYNRDMATQANVADPLRVLIERSITAPPTRPNLFATLVTRIQNAPIEVGEAASQIQLVIPPHLKR